MPALGFMGTTSLRQGFSQSPEELDYTKDEDEATE